MKLFKVLTVALATLVATVTSSYAKIPTIELKESNTIGVLTPITAELTKNVNWQLVSLSQALPNSATIYLFLDTPGGSVTEGFELIQAAKALPQKVVTITQFAASMGFIIAQNLGTRHILPNGIMMSHRASGGVKGQIPGEADTRLAFWHDYLKAVDIGIAKRVGLTLEEYRNLTFSEFWTTGDRAVAKNMADKVVRVRCHKSLGGSYLQKISTLFGSVFVEWAQCPLISAPLGTDFTRLTTYDEVEIKLVKEVMFQLLYDKKSVTEEVLKSEKFRKVFK